MSTIWIAIMNPSYYKKELYRVIGQYATATRVESNGNLFRMFPVLLRILLARLLYNVGPLHYSLYQFGKLDRSEWSDYITDTPDFKNFLYSRGTEEAHFILRDKIAFHAHCIRHSLPTIPVLCVVTSKDKYLDYHDICVTNKSKWKSKSAHFSREIFVKPVDGFHGHDAFVAQVDGEHVRFLGQELLIDRFYDYLQSALSTAISGWLIQPRVYPNKSIERILTSEGVTTARIVTYMKNGRAALLAAEAKITVGGNVVDNFANGSLGNLIAAINLESGELAPAWGSTQKDWPKITQFYRHPDFNTWIAGFRLPRWDMMTELAIRAQESLPTLCSVGWDIADTTDGIVVIEGNSTYGMAGIQVAYQKGWRSEIEAALK